MDAGVQTGRFRCIRCGQRWTDLLQCEECRTAPREERPAKETPAAEVALPVVPAIEPPPAEWRITLPWPMLVSANVRHQARAGTDDHVLYSRAREAIRAYARLVAGRAAPVYTGPVALHARVWVPDQRRRDVGNFGKVVEDGLEQAAYLNDHQIKRSTWEEAGLDAAYPRAEITVEPLEPTRHPEAAMR